MGCMVYGAVWLYAHTALYGAVCRCMAVWRQEGGVTMRGTCMERHTAKYSGIQRKSIQSAIQSYSRPSAHVAGHPAGRALQRSPGRLPGTHERLHVSECPIVLFQRVAEVCDGAALVRHTAATPYSLPYSCMAPYRCHALSRLPPGATAIPVSYTHLTLPTIPLV